SSKVVVRPRNPRTLARSAGAVLVPKFTAFMQVTLSVTTITCSTLRGTLRTLTPLQPRIRQPMRHLLIRRRPVVLPHRRQQPRLQEAAHTFTPATTPDDEGNGRHELNTGHCVRQIAAATRCRSRASAGVSSSRTGSHTNPFADTVHGPTPAGPCTTRGTSTGG